jgi:hypothetical protein
VKAIHQSDLFSLFIGSTVIGYRDFKHSGVNFFALGNDFDFKSKAGRFYNKISGDFASHGVVACFNVREIQVGQHIICKRQELICQIIT